MTMWKVVLVAEVVPKCLNLPAVGDVDDVGGVAGIGGPRDRLEEFVEEVLELVIFEVSKEREVQVAA